MSKKKQVSPWRLENILKSQKTMTFDQFIDSDEEAGKGEMDIGMVSDDVKRLASIWRTCERRKDVLHDKLEKGKHISRDELDELKMWVRVVPLLEHIVVIYLEGSFNLWGDTIKLHKGFRAGWKIKKSSKD